MHDVLLLYPVCNIILHAYSLLVEQSVFVKLLIC